MINVMVINWILFCDSKKLDFILKANLLNEVLLVRLCVPVY
jgi:hypothetical protein